MAPSSHREILDGPLRQKFVDILKSNGIPDQVETITLTEPAALKGQHFSSNAVYILVEFQDSSLKPKNLFVKKSVTNSGHAEFLKDMQFMDKESTFFVEFLPKLKKFCSNYKGCENLLNFFPEVLYGDDEMIVFENLVLDDTFIMLDREARQDLNTSKIVLENLAKFHAITHAFIKIECNGSEKFLSDWHLVCCESFINEKNPMIETMFDHVVTTCIHFLKGHPVPGDSKAMEILAGYLGKTYLLMTELLRYRPEEKLHVVNHGDCQNNNMMFKLDPETEKITDHVFVDLQITRLASPNVDLGYFLYTSVKNAVRRQNLTELLQHYFTNFVKTLTMFDENCPISFEDFVKDYSEKSQFGFFFNLNILTALEVMKDINFDNMSDDPKTYMDEFTALINDWIVKHPEKSSEISVEIVAVINENEKILDDARSS